MDQDSFRQLLQSSSSRATPSSRPGVKQAKTISASEPAFKPRKIKKEAKYRDRAAERRVGGGNDYAQVEAVLEDFNKRTADQGKDVVDAQRGYLGGDSEHTILVKGLDVALLEQNKMKAAASSVDDDTLEKAFLGEVPESTVPKKRTREDIVRELKAKRSKTEDSQQPPAKTDAPLPSNKFKPIGFKPIGQSDAEVKKKKKVKNGDRVKKKKQNVELTAKTEGTSQPAPSEPPKDSPKPLPALKPSEPEPELPEDFDIFEGAGEYEGLDVGDDDSDNDTSPLKEDNLPLDDKLLNKPGGWFNDDLPPPVTSQSKSPLDAVPAPVPVPVPSVPDEDEEEEADNDRPIRLVPLESSALPSIKDFLLMDQTAGSAEKRRKRKEKTKGAKDAGGEPKKLNAEAKADRDYKKSDRCFLCPLLTYLTRIIAG
ncbi:uncharacterized protein EV420DRAFT_1636023 [Desarmillaria tabescens]|uniref:RED-like N-terminal domain-containing protein n=1 Tax=Armillaria tabescens TaxID=1929756 RepID=A0AA39NJV1_ARMTA|nr:uncharacterized protein EV420DRAFT_1636023 [Desarmillaria tabescens]KAK0466989.1 hypothetical protein EV420DRAFT_1636023 [Desarmillaria tabescens]